MFLGQAIYVLGPLQLARKSFYSLLNLYLPRHVSIDPDIFGELTADPHE